MILLEANIFGCTKMETGMDPSMSLENVPRKTRRIPYIKIFLGLVMLVIYFTIAAQGRNREFKIVQSTHQEFLTLQREGASASEWDLFKKNTHAKIDPLITNLEEFASSDTPQLQHMLWACRDYLYPMLENAQTERTPDQHKFEKHLEAAEQIMNKNWILKLFGG
ncbi:hypothetical protein Enr17x_58290 [Gimesia fumaroli]|uniref:Uncharacterized protein n=2 Tax=Gimesia fumaroli TaxID=2527976 RepID=A0A518IKX8_9PLAN|nr:hypothetical protein Enr17x_58290 [Gimesia fumaroli]